MALNYPVQKVALSAIALNMEDTSTRVYFQNAGELTREEGQQS